MKYFFFIIMMSYSVFGFSNQIENGTVELIGDELIYTPNLNVVGYDEIEYQVCDQTCGVCKTNKVKIYIGFQLDDLPFQPEITE